MPGLGYHISGKQIEVCASGSPRLFPVIRAQLAGLPRFPTPSAVSLGSLVLNPKPHGTFSWPTSKSPFTPFLTVMSFLHSSKLLRALHRCYILLSGFLSCVAKGAPKPRGSSRHGCCTWFKSQHQSSSAAPFPTPPITSYTCQHSRVLPALLGCHSKSGQAWPHGVEPIFSKLSRRPCHQRKLPPSYILGGSHFHPPGSKLGHSYLTYL